VIIKTLFFNISQEQPKKFFFFSTTVANYKNAVIFTVFVKWIFEK